MIPNRVGIISSIRLIRYVANEVLEFESIVQEKHHGRMPDSLFTCEAVRLWERTIQTNRSQVSADTISRYGTAYDMPRIPWESTRTYRVVRCQSVDGMIGEYVYACFRRV